MQTYEYKVVSAPNRSEKVAGAKTPSDRFAATLAQAMNALARDGWEYVRADTLPSEERSGFTKRTTVYHTVLVFRRPVPAQPDALTLAAEQRFRTLSADAPTGKAPAIRAEPAHAAPRLGAPVGGPAEDH